MPGWVETQVTSVESKSNLIVDSHVQNEGNGWAGSGANPWHLDNDTESILFLTNESDKAARIGFQITANGSAAYSLTKLRLNAHETRALDLRKLRDAQRPDLKGNKIPATASDGSVIWVRGDNLPVMGRLMLIHRHAGMASNYDCCICACPYSYEPAIDYIDPASANVAVNGTVDLTFYAGYEDCNDNYYYYDESEGVSWSSDDPNIASVGSSGTVTGQSAGTTSVWAEYYDYYYVYNPYEDPTCDPLLEYGTAGATITVADGTPVITSVNPDNWLVGATTTGVIISGEYFGTNPIVNFSDPAVTSTRISASDTQITCNITVGANASGGEVDVTVTSQGYNGSGFIALPNGGSQATSSSYPADKQRPAFVSVGTATTGSIQCGSTNFFARYLKIPYQVLDTTESPILRSGMKAAEQLSWTSSTCTTSNGCGQKPTAASWSTDSTGSFPDTIYNCSATCTQGGSCNEDWQQTFTVNAKSVGIINGSTQGTLNCITTSCSSSPQGVTH
jgi:hypothetical protein